MNKYIVTIKYNAISGPFMSDKVQFVTAKSFVEASKKAMEHVVKHHKFEWAKVKHVQLLS